VTTKQIRTHYSGFILFAAKLITVLTGIGFTLILTRTLLQDAYGTWGKFNILIPYFTLLSTAVPFWIMRFVARGKEGATKTGILANATFAVLATLAYLAFNPIILPAFGFENYLPVYLLVSVQIFELYFMGALEASLQAKEPHYVGYGLLIGESSKLLLAYVLVVVLGLALPGAFLSIIIAFAIKIGFYFRRLVVELRKKIQFDYVKQWIKGSTFNIYNILGDRIAAVIFIMLALFGGDIAASYYYAALPIANIITYSSFLAFALYPTILAENRVEEATTSIKLVLMFALPMTVGALMLPGSFLTILQEGNVYVPAEPVLRILAIDSLVLTISGIFSSVLFGIERLDDKAMIPFKKVAKSRLFVVFSLPYIHSVITIPTAFYVLTNLTGSDPLLIAMYATAINTAAHMAIFLVLYVIVQKAVKVSIPWKNIGKYLLAAAPMAIFLYAFPHPARLYSTLIVTAVAGAIYLGFLMAIDKEARNLPKIALREIRNRTSSKS